MPKVSTVTVPDHDLLGKLSPVADGLDIAMWDFQGEPDGVSLDQVDAVILPYVGAGAVLHRLADVPHLQLVQTQTTGYDGVPEAVGPDVAIASASGVHAASTAELAIGLMLASLRGIDIAARDQRAGIWRSERYLSLADRRVLIVGAGGIGNEIAKRLASFEVELTRVGRSARDDELGHVHAVAELTSLATTADVLVVITTLSDDTKGLIGADVLANLPDGALVVNVARGAVVDSAALTAEVVSGRLRCAIDVFDPEPLPAGHPLWLAENALVTPHLGGNTSAFEPRILKLLTRQLAALAAGEAPANLVQRGSF